ncbi:hypothetical protein AB0H34_00990 [Saccharopolyspora shandongensis]|uniref:hypothetical protein n=1 Tax=Saccharopolyspora shandongensis TaxID=418495 RepID=UPI003410AA9C
MTELTAYERTWLAVLEELRSCPEVQLTRDHQGKLNSVIGDADKAFAELAEWDGVALDPALKNSYLRFSSLAACWWIPDPEYPDESVIAGEFDLNHIYSVVQGEPLTQRLYDPSPEEFQLFTELRSFDGTGQSGVGHLSMLRFQPGVVNPEVWFDTTAQGHHRLDLDYPGYLEALRITKGTFGWQFLFADVSLSDDEFEVTRQFMEIMLDVFPRLFPEHDYEPLRALLAERLG